MVLPVLFLAIVRHFFQDASANHRIRRDYSIHSWRIIIHPEGVLVLPESRTLRETSKLPNRDDYGYIILWFMNTSREYYGKQYPHNHMVYEQGVLWKTVLP